MNEDNTPIFNPQDSSPIPLGNTEQQHNPQISNVGPIPERDFEINPHPSDPTK